MITVNGYEIRLVKKTNKVIIFDFHNNLTKDESLGIMLYLEEEGFLEEHFATSGPIRVEIQRRLL